MAGLNISRFPLQSIWLFGDNLDINCVNTLITDGIHINVESVLDCVTLSVQADKCVGIMRRELVDRNPHNFGFRAPPERGGLILSRLKGQGFTIWLNDTDVVAGMASLKNEGIWVEVADVKGSVVKMRIFCSQHLTILRDELNRHAG